MSDLYDIEAIKRVKYRYFRCLDLKQWDDLRDCLTPDVTAAYDSGKYSFSGRDALMQFLIDALGRSSVLTMHHGHHPEIDLTSATTATGVWALEDKVIDVKGGITLRGAAFYRDEYVKVDGI